MPGFFWQLLITYFVGTIGGLLFHWLHLPLPWILGPVTSLILFKLIPYTKTTASLRLRKVSFSILGIQIGSTFTAATLPTVFPYLFPYTGLTLLLIALSLVSAYLIAKWVKIDVTTSLLGSIPGGLSTVLAMSDSFRGNTVLVTIFQTIRLVAVLFIIPFSATHLFFEQGHIKQGSVLLQVEEGPEWTIALFIAAFMLGLLLQKWVPASLVIIPMLITALLQINGIALYQLPSGAYLFAQLTIGVYLGNSISVKDLQKAGRLSLYFLCLAILLIATSFLFGFLFSWLTNLNAATAVLSLAPGGLIEMALTAQSVNGDPSVVSSLQMIRLLTIVLILPFFLKWLLKRLEKEHR
ncbi:AbrB family transcriptional regulator [Virgibacillus senegalensis]|uniref:AbrB family transcriptional regulator n=1 Tax=Virgibacillus senegalensis TaxID=1499679 RepID=UPI000A9A0802|nr:AbrB family transcriptional regulator [Virgibacillus senegalensis]